MALKARFLLVLKGAGFLVYGYCLMYTVAHHVIDYVVVSSPDNNSDTQATPHPFMPWSMHIMSQSLIMSSVGI